MKIESVRYSIGDLACRGALVYDESVRGEPLLLMAPNWLGVTRDNIAVGEMPTKTPVRPGRGRLGLPYGNRSRFFGAELGFSGPFWDCPSGGGREEDWLIPPDFPAVRRAWRFDAFRVRISAPPLAISPTISTTWRFGLGRVPARFPVSLASWAGVSLRR